MKTRKGNFFSALGLVSVLLSGGLTVYLWNKNGTVKPNAGLLFGIKEALIPLVLGVAILTSHRSTTPLIRVFLYNDTIFDIPKIENRVAEISGQAEYDKLLLGATRLFAASFFLSSLMNLGLAQWFFRGFDATAIDALEKYNAIIARVTGWGFRRHRRAHPHFPLLHPAQPAQGLGKTHRLQGRGADAPPLNEKTGPPATGGPALKNRRINPPDCRPAAPARCRARSLRRHRGS